MGQAASFFAGSGYFAAMLKSLAFASDSSMGRLRESKAIRLAKFRNAETLGLFAALRDNQGGCGRFLGTIAGTVSIPEFFSPENLRLLTTI